MSKLFNYHKSVDLHKSVNSTHADNLHFYLACLLVAALNTPEIRYPDKTNINAVYLFLTTFNKTLKN